MTTASPALTAVTLPAPSTVATSVLSELHATFRLSALSGFTVAVSVSVSPSVNVSSALSRVTSVTFTALAFTVTAQVPDLPSAVAVTVAVPGLMPWTVPVLSTVATLRSDDDQLTTLSDAASGETLADSAADPPSMISIRDGVTVTDETPTVTSFLPQEVMRRMAAAAVSSARRVCVCVCVCVKRSYRLMFWLLSRESYEFSDALVNNLAAIGHPFGLYLVPALRHRHGTCRHGRRQDKNNKNFQISNEYAGYNGRYNGRTTMRPAPCPLPTTGAETTNHSTSIRRIRDLWFGKCLLSLNDR